MHKYLHDIFLLLHENSTTEKETLEIAQGQALEGT